MNADDVHVWFAPLDRIDPSTDLLSHDERARADRFAMPHIRDRYIAARTLLRTHLAHVCHCPPQAIVFAYGPQGKPFLPNSEVRFNLSHSGDWAALAITRGRDVGIDVEQIRPDRSLDELAERFFSARESATLQTIHADERPAAFYRCWTRKEAFIKLVGEGLSFPLDEFEVTLRASEPATLLSVRGAAADRWSLHELRAPAGYEAALAVQGTPRHLIVKQTIVRD